MSWLECKLGVSNAKRFPSGFVSVNISEDDHEWISSQTLAVSGWDYPMLVLSGGLGTGVVTETESLSRSVLKRHGFNVPNECRVYHLVPDTNYDVTHENLIIPDMLVPEFPIENNYDLTLGAFKQGMSEAFQRAKLVGEGTLVTCMEEGTRRNFMFMVDPEDANFFSGTKVKFTQHGQPLFLCEDMKYRSAIQELFRRKRFGVPFGAPDVLTRRLTDNKFDLRKGSTAIFRTVRKAGR